MGKVSVAYTSNKTTQLTSRQTPHHIPIPASDICSCSTVRRVLYSCLAIFIYSALQCYIWLFNFRALQYSSNLPYSKRVGSPVAALPIWWTLYRWSLQIGKWELQKVVIHFIHDYTLVLYSQLIQTGSQLLLLQFSTVHGFKHYKCTPTLKLC